MAEVPDARPAARRARILVASMALTFLVVRLWLHARPDSDLTVAGYNIHHLFTGLLILTICGIPAILGAARGRLSDLTVAGFGVGLSLALDEWVYLIATDGSNQSYLLPISLWPGAALVLLACVYAWILGRPHRTP